MVNKLWFLAFIALWFNNNFILCDVIPTLNLDALGGELGFIGDYAGLSPIKSLSQFESLPPNNHGLIISDTIDDINIFNLFATINGTIESYCQLTDNQYILAGNFDTINGTTYNHIAQFDITSKQLSPLQQGLDGPVRSIYCTDTNIIYVGGDFIAPRAVTNTTAYTGHVALWQNNQWSPVPWKGLNGPVYSIIQHGQSILFGGHFDSTGDGKFASLNTSQTINLASSAIISGGNSALSGNNSDPAGVICSKSPWLLQDGVPGYWEAQFGTSNSPSVFRISNTHLAEKGTNEFNIIALGSNRYFELSYKDPVTNEILTCSEKCYLSNDTSIPYQDFTVTNNLTANALRININTWYGTGGGLGGVDIFTSDVSLQPHISQNTDTSASGCSSASSSSTATVTGNWTEVYSYQTYENFLIANIPANGLQQATDLSVTYKPFIPVQEVYNVYLTTPGCVGTSTCNQRTQVALDISMMPGNTSTITIDQRNTADNRSLIYTGPIAASTDSFQPTVMLHIAPNANVPSSSTASIVADSIQFIRNSTSARLTGILNYFPSNNTWVPLAQQLPPTATVRTLQSNGNQVFIGGEFAVNGSFSNIVAYDGQVYQPLKDAGLNGNVTSSVLVGSQLVLGGVFTNTINPQPSNLNRVAIYDVQANTWSAMNDGVNDRVDYIYTTKDNNVHLSGAFSYAGGVPAFNNAEWNLSNRKWVPSSSFINGPTSNHIQIDDKSTLYLGSIKSAQTYRANSIASLNNNKNQWRSDITTADPNATITSGVVWKNENGKSIVILGGLFHLGDTLYHVAYQMDDGIWVGMLKNIQGDVKTMYVVQDLLYIGGQFNGTLDDSPSRVISFAVYDLKKKAFQDVQGLTTSDGKPGLVNAIKPQADGKNMFVAGNFAFAGLLNCNSICELSSDSRQWTQLTQDNIQGNIKDIAVRNGVVTAVGDLVIGSSPSSLAVLNNVDTTTVASWKPVVSNINLSHILNDGTGKYLVSGLSDKNQPYLGSWDGNTLTSMDTVTTKLGPTSDIRQVTYVPVSSSPSDARYPTDSDQVLLAVGHLDIPNFGNCSAALFDGATWYPYILTSSVNGTSGSIHSSFATMPCCTFDYNKKHLSVPAVILVSIAISLGIIFFCIALAFIFIIFKRRKSEKYYQPDPMQEWKPKHRPHSLLAMLDAAHLNDSAIFNTGAGVGAAAAIAGASRDDKDETTAYTTALDSKGQQHSLDLSDQTRLRSSSGFSAGADGLSMIPFSVMMANALKSDSDDSLVASEETPKVYYAKFPFEAKEFGELAFDAHTPIVVTDTSDNVWWMGYKDDGSNHPISGLFPSNYVSRVKPT